MTGSTLNILVKKQHLLSSKCWVTLLAFLHMLGQLIIIAHLNGMCSYYPVHTGENRHLVVDGLVYDNTDTTARRWRSRYLPLGSLPPNLLW